MRESVLKAGGSSVSSARNISNVANIIVDYYLSNLDSEANVVVSAFGVEPEAGDKKNKTTDRLLTAAKYAHQGNEQQALLEIAAVKERHYSIIKDLWRMGLDNKLTDETFAMLEGVVGNAFVSQSVFNETQLKDLIGGSGELLSTPILAEVVQKRLEGKLSELEQQLRNSHLDDRQKAIYERLKSCHGQYIVVADVRNQGFVTDSNYANARLLETSIDAQIAGRHQILRGGNRNRILFYPGFIARDEHGNTTTLGRDGSNVTAIALGTAINAREIVICTDTDGELIIDPRIIGQAQTARYLSYKESSILSQWGGMQVLKPDSLYILHARNTNIPIRVMNSFNPADPGTLITEKSTGSNSYMKGVSVVNDIVYVQFTLAERDQAARIEDEINAYNGAKVLLSVRENRNGHFVAKFAVKADANGNANYLSELEDRLRQNVFGEILPKEQFVLAGASLITVCGEGVQKSYADISRIESIVAGLPISESLRNSKYGLPVFTGEDLIQIVVRKDDVQHTARSIYNQLKRVNVVVYGLGNIGSAFLKKVVEQYDTLGLNVVGVADSTGIYAKPGGFGAADLSKIIEWKSGGTKIQDMNEINGGVHLSEKQGNLARVYEIGKGDFVSVDATSNPDMLDTLISALESGSRIISVNKLPYAIQPLKHAGKGPNLEQIADQKARRLYRAMMTQQLFNRGTVGADLGVPGTLLDILAKNPDYVTAIGCMSGTLGYTCSALDRGMSLSEAVQSAVDRKITESTPFTDYSGMDVLNKTTILWRAIATKYGLGFFDCKINYKGFIDEAIERYEQRTGKTFDKNGLGKLKGQEFAERVEALDKAFAELKAEIGNDRVFRYVGEISYDEHTGRYSLDVRLKDVHKESVLGSLDGTENMFLFGVQGAPSISYGIRPGPGAGVPQTADAIMNDLIQINRLAREEARPTIIQTKKYRPFTKTHNAAPRYSPRNIPAPALRMA